MTLARLTDTLLLLSYFRYLCHFIADDLICQRDMRQKVYNTFEEKNMKHLIR